MAASLYQRVASRGFPTENIAGQSGQGSLPDSTLPSGPGAGQATATWTNPNLDPGSVPATLPPPEVYVDTSGAMWGLPGGVNPDDTPHTHAAPMADFTLPQPEYWAEADATHAPLFSGPQVRMHPGTLAAFPMERFYGEGGGRSVQDPADGASGKALGGLDAVQGYGGGGAGPGGLNPAMPHVTDQRAYPGETYVNASYVQAAEVPFLVPEVTQFIASAPELPPYSPPYAVPTANVSAQVTTGPDVPATGPALAPETGYVYTPGYWG